MGEFNLKDVFRTAFGYDAPERTFTIDAAPGRLETASLGGRYYDTDIFGREFFLPVQLDGYVLPFAVVSVMCKKTIVSTPMPERGGTVKELISIDDYQINVKGIIVNDDNVFPESEIIDLHELFLKAESVNMQCVLTDIFLKGAFNQRVVIKDLKFPAVTGIEHAKPFEMELESDMIFDLMKKSN
jgi:hypothetical protein